MTLLELQVEDHQIGCSHCFNNRTMTTELYIKEKKKTFWIMLDPVVEYTVHAQWAEYMLQTVQLDERMKP